MKRLSLVLGVTLGLAVATLAGLWTAGSHSASAGQPFDEALKCYRAKVLGSDRPDNRLIYIQDQFEAKNTIVKKPTEFCALANKYELRNVAGSDESPLLCYAIKDAPRQAKFRRTDLLVQDQFTEQFLQLLKPYSLCEEASKQLSTGAGVSGFNEDPDYTFKCYKVRRLENDGERFEKVTLPLFDQFSAPEGKETRLLRPALFCSQVEEKKRKAKNDDIENARELIRGEEVHVSTISTTSERSDPDLSCVGAYGHTAWYTYYASSDVYAVIDTSGSTYDTVLGVFRGSPGNFEELACDDDSGDDQASYIQTKLAGGETYYIVVGAFGATAAGKLKVNLYTEPFNCIVDCAGAQAASDQGSGDVAGGGQDIMCYTISQRAPEEAVLQVFDQLNSHEIELGRGTMFCTPAGKCVLSPNPSGSQGGVDIKKKC